MIASMNTPALKSTEPSAPIAPAPAQTLAVPAEPSPSPLAAGAQGTTAAAHPLILVVHASVGSGHRSAANAIAEALEEAGEAARAAGDDNSLEARSEVRSVLSP